MKKIGKLATLDLISRYWVHKNSPPLCDAFRETSQLLPRLDGFHRENPQQSFNDYLLPSKVITPQYTDNPQMNQNILLNTLDDFNEYTFVYTDGSKKHDGVGCAFLIPQTNFTRSYKLPEIYSTFSAEDFAISKALDRVCADTSKICILTDSLSVLKLLESNLTPFAKINPIVRQIKTKLQIEKSRGSRIVFIWTKAHSGITHNEVVDNLAKAAVNNIDLSTQSLCISDCINLVKKNTRNEWATIYHQYCTNTLTQYARIQEDLPKQPWFYDLKVSRRYAVMYTRLRFGHGRYPTFLARIGIINSDICEICNVPGKFVPETESEERQRSLKSQGSCKIGASCTNQIIIKKTDGKCKVTYYKEHDGHPIELQHIPISKKNRNMLAAQLSSGVHNKKVLGNIRDNIGNKLKRIDLLDRKDLQNIKNSYNLKQDEGKLHKEDSISIDLWVEDQRSNVNNCVLLYKRQGEDHHLLEKDDFTLIFMNKSQEFMLKNYGGNIITVDSTHGLNPYDFELTTLLVLDEFGEGFPTACMFTNRKDTLVNEIFFSLIKNQVGSISPKVFMTDITNVFYNAWIKVMGAPLHQLYCSWHIDRAWQINRNKISNTEKRNWVYKTLKLIQTNLVKEKFENLLQKTMCLLLEDPDTKAFGEYFHTNYFFKRKMWAYCYRKSCGINTNMHIESMHKTIKYFYLEGKRVQRLDKALHAIITFIRDKVVERFIKNVKGKTNSHIKEILNRHNSASSLACQLYVMENGTTYILKTEEKEYVVVKEPPNKKIKKQVSFYSTKKKKTRHQNKKPTQLEAQCILDVLNE
nr:unnamed protein product [Callosobruchus chinensis]